LIDLDKIKKKYAIKSVLHVFVVANSLQALLINEYIYRCGISTKSILLVDLRSIDQLSYIHNKVDIHSNITKRFLNKYLNIDLDIIKIKKYIAKLNKNFILYVPWNTALFHALRKSHKCLGHVYIEEGDLSYWEKNVLCDWSNINQKELRNHVKSPAKINLFSKDCIFIIATNFLCFPVLQESNKLVFENFYHISKFYSQSLTLTDRVGILPSGHRLLGVDLIKVLKSYCKHMEKGDCLKLHPSSNNYKNLRRELSSANAKINNFFKIIENEVILEAEMQFRSLTICGPHSSLERYAVAFGARFIQIPELINLQEGRS
jgi:hypothetical protein